MRAKTLIITSLMLACLCFTAVGPPSVDAAPAFSGTETQITTNIGDQFDPAISGDHIVFTDLRGADADVWYYDLATGTETIVTPGTSGPYGAPGNQQLTDISDGRIAYSDYRSYDVVVYDIETGTTTILTASNTAPALDPAIGGDLVAFEDLRTGNREMFAQDLATGEVRQLSECTCLDQKPAVSDGIVVWEKCSAGLCDIMCYDWAANEARLLTSTLGDERNPDVDGRYVVYDALRGSDRDVCVYDLVTDTEYLLLKPGVQVNPSVSGDYITFEDASEGIYHVWVAHIAADGSIDGMWDTSDYGVPSTSAQFLSDIDGDRVIYTDDRGGQLDIYLYEFAVEQYEVVRGADLTATVNTATVQWGDTASWTITVTNTGNEEDTFELNPAITLGEIPWGDFTFDANPVTLAAGESTTVTVTSAMPAEWKATTDLHGSFTVWTASTADPDTVLDELVLYITVEPTRTSTLLSLEEMVKDAIADLNAQLAHPTRDGVYDVRNELQAIIAVINQAEADGLLTADEAQALRASAQAALNAVTKACISLDADALKKALNELNTSGNQSNALLNKLEEMLAAK